MQIVGVTGFRGLWAFKWTRLETDETNLRCKELTNLNAKTQLCSFCSFRNLSVYTDE